MSGLALSGGNLKAGFIGGLSGAAFYGVGHSAGMDGFFSSLGGGEEFARVVAHGVVGGVSGELQGGDFLSGFMAAGFTKAAVGINGLFENVDGPSLGNTIKAAVLGGTASVIGGGKFANGAITGAMSRALNDQGGDVAQKSGQMGRNNKSPYFKGKTEQEILDYMQSEGLWNGKDDITFFGERPLGGPDGVFVRLGKNLNINVLHEHAFGIEGGRLVNIGYTGKDLGVAADPVLSQGDYSSYTFSRTVYQGSMNSAANSVLQSGGWGAGDYGLVRHNCQDFADAMRGTFSP